MKRIDIILDIFHTQRIQLLRENKEPTKVYLPLKSKPYFDEQMKDLAIDTTGSITHLNGLKIVWCVSIPFDEIQVV